MKTRYIILLACLLTGASFADTLSLRDGQVVEGNFIGGTPRQIQMEIGGIVRTFAIADVVNLSFASAPVMAPLPPAPYPSEAAAPQPVYPQQPAYAPQPAYGIVLPAGTRIVVRLIDGVDSERDRLGQAFTASLDEPVYANGQQIIPRGAEAIIKLVDASESGKFAGRSALTLNLQSVMVNGRMVDINTQSFTAQSSSRGARTAKMGIGGGALGAAIGAIAGGGKGAAIGAGAGAGAGVGAEVLTKGQRVRIPSESRLAFVLDSGVRL